MESSTFMAAGSPGVGEPILVTVPVKNEAPRLRSSVLALKEALDRSGLAYQLSIAEDGSTDGTKHVLAELQALIPGLIVQVEPRSLGRGKALRKLWGGIPASVYCFTDADLAAGSRAVVEAIEQVLGGEDVVIGSRYVAGARLDRPPLRSAIARAYNRLTRALFSEPIRDHQCGLKAFRGSVIREILPQTVEDSWFWDTEIVVLSVLRGYAVSEMPVHWVEHKVRRTSLRRLYSDIVLHGTGLLRLRGRLSERAHAPSPVLARELVPGTPTECTSLTGDPVHRISASSVLNPSRWPGPRLPQTDPEREPITPRA